MADESPDALRAMALASRAASRALQALSSEERCAILHRIADGLLASQDAILAGAARASAAAGATRARRLTRRCACAANAEDVAAAKAAGTADALLARLYLTPAKLAQLAGTRAAYPSFSPLFSPKRLALSPPHPAARPPALLCRALTCVPLRSRRARHRRAA